MFTHPREKKYEHSLVSKIFLLFFQNVYKIKKRLAKGT